MKSPEINQRNRNPRNSRKLEDAQESFHVRHDSRQSDLSSSKGYEPFRGYQVDVAPQRIPLACRGRMPDFPSLHPHCEDTQEGKSQQQFSNRLPAIQLGPLALIHQDEELHEAGMPSGNSSFHGVRPSGFDSCPRRTDPKAAQIGGPRSVQLPYMSPESSVKTANQVPRSPVSVSELSRSREDCQWTPGATFDRPAKDPILEGDSSRRSKVEAAEDASFNPLLKRGLPRHSQSSDYVDKSVIDQLKAIRNGSTSSPCSSPSHSSLRIKLKSKMRELPQMKNKLDKTSVDGGEEAAGEKSVLSNLASLFRKNKKAKPAEPAPRPSPRFGQFDFQWGSALKQDAHELPIVKKRSHRFKRSIISQAVEIAQPLEIQGEKKAEESRSDFVQRDILADTSSVSSMASIRKSQNQFLSGGVLDSEDFDSRKTIIRYNSRRKAAWDVFISLVAVHEGFIIPLEIGFDFTLGYAYELVPIGLFLVDLIFNSRQTFFLKSSGDEVTTPALIFKHYIQSFGFWIDLMAAIPFYLIFENLLPSANLLHCAQILKVLRAFRLEALQNQSELWKLTMRLLFLLMGLVYYIHLTTCVIFYIARIDKQWVPQMTRFEENSIYNEPLLVQYLGTGYSSIMMLTGNEINPSSNLMIGAASVLTVLGALVVANIIGTMAVVSSTLNRKSQRFQDKIDMANTSMRNMKIPSALQDDIRLFMIQTQNNLDSQKELDIFMQMISPSLRNQVTKHIFTNAVSANPILSGSDDLVDFLLNDVTTLLYLPEDTIIRQGQAGDSLFLIAKGDCTVWVKDHMRNTQFVRSLSQGEYFGEIAILSDVARTATVKSSNYCTMACLHKTVFFDLCNNFPDVLIKMKQKSTRYDDPWKKFKMLLLEQVDYFKPFKSDPDFFEDIQHHLQEEFIDPETEITTDGEVCQSIVFVVQGLIELYTQDEEGKDVLMASLNQGDVIGQYSVLFEENFKFTARAVTKTRILTLSQKFFSENQHLIDLLEEAVEEAEIQVEQNGIPIFDFSTFAPLPKEVIERLKASSTRISASPKLYTHLKEPELAANHPISTSSMSSDSQSLSSGKSPLPQRRPTSHVRLASYGPASLGPSPPRKKRKKVKKQPSNALPRKGSKRQKSIAQISQRRQSVIRQPSSLQISSKSSCESDTSSAFKSPQPAVALAERAEEQKVLSPKEAVAKAEGQGKLTQEAEAGPPGFDQPGDLSEISRDMFVLQERPREEEDSFENRPTTRQTFSFRRKRAPSILNVRQLEKRGTCKNLEVSPALKQLPKKKMILGSSEGSMKRTRQFAEMLKKKLQKD